MHFSINVVAFEGLVYPFFLSKYETFIYVNGGIQTTVTTQYLVTPSLVSKFSHFPSGAWHPWKLSLVHCQVSVYSKRLSREQQENGSIVGFDFSAVSGSRQPGTAGKGYSCGPSKIRIQILALAL